jgi:hypothetical protein
MVEQTHVSCLSSKRPGSTEDGMYRVSKATLTQGLVQNLVEAEIEADAHGLSRWESQPSCSYGLGMCRPGSVLSLFDLRHSALTLRISAFHLRKKIAGEAG